MDNDSPQIIITDEATIAAARDLFNAIGSLSPDKESETCWMVVQRVVDEAGRRDAELDLALQYVADIVWNKRDGIDSGRAEDVWSPIGYVMSVAEAICVSRPWDEAEFEPAYFWR